MKERINEGENSMDLKELHEKKGFICDMDGVIYHGNRLLPGVKEFVDWLYAEKKPFLFLTNSSERSPRSLFMRSLQAPSASV